MASEVFSGSKWEKPYTNNTPQNVRVVINFMQSLAKTIPSGTPGRLSSNNPTIDYELTLNWAGVSVSAISKGNSRRVRGPLGVLSTVDPGGPITIGRNLAFFNSLPRDNTLLQIFLEETPISSNNCANGSMGDNQTIGFPTEIILAPKDTFNAVCGKYNIVVIPENG